MRQAAALLLAILLAGCQTAWPTVEIGSTDPCDRQPFVQACHNGGGSGS